jgi:hypothetical protein
VKVVGRFVARVDVGEVDALDDRLQRLVDGLGPDADVDARLAGAVGEVVPGPVRDLDDDRMPGQVVLLVGSRALVLDRGLRRFCASTTARWDSCESPIGSPSPRKRTGTPPFSS